MNIIDRAADRLRGRWTQGAYTDKAGNVCLRGALEAVGDDWRTNTDDIVTEALYQAMRESGIRHGLVTHFNDDPRTTEEDVLLLMKKASVRYDELRDAASS